MGTSFSYSLVIYVPWTSAHTRQCHFSVFRPVTRDGCDLANYRLCAWREPTIHDIALAGQFWGIESKINFCHVIKICGSTLNVNFFFFFLWAIKCLQSNNNKTFLVNNSTSNIFLLKMKWTNLGTKFGKNSPEQIASVVVMCSQNLALSFFRDFIAKLGTVIG